MRREKFTITGMMCDHCKARIDQILNSIPGIIAEVSRNPDIVIITFKEDKNVSLEEINKILQDNAGTEYRINPIV